MNTTILDEIIQATQDRKTTEIIRINDIKDLMTVVSAKDVTTEEEVRYDAEKEFCYSLYTEALENIAFVFKQIKFVLNSNEYICPWFEMLDFELRLNIMVRAIEENIGEIQKYLFDCLELMDNKELVSGIVYTLSSVNIDDSFLLDQLMICFTKCEDDFLSCYVQGLKFGRHPDISEKLLLLLENSPDSVKEASLKILIYRNEIKKEKILSLLQIDHFNSELIDELKFKLSENYNEWLNRTKYNNFPKDIELTFRELLEILQSPDSVANDRQFAYYEFSVRSGFIVDFKIDYPIPEQYEIIKQLSDYYSQNLQDTIR